jgi:hypothetical protein
LPTLRLETSSQSAEQLATAEDAVIDLPSSFECRRSAADLMATVRSVPVLGGSEILRSGKTTCQSLWIMNQERQMLGADPEGAAPKIERHQGYDV